MTGSLPRTIRQHGGSRNTRSCRGCDWYDSYAAKSILGRWARPREMVGMVVYLASEASSYVTAPSCSGGWTAADGRFTPPL